MKSSDPHRLPWLLLCSVVAAAYAFILAPILITAVSSFRDSTVSAVHATGWTTKWWLDALSPAWTDTLIFSLQLAAGAAAISVMLALPLSFAIARHAFRWRQAVISLSLAPMLLPSLVTGLGILQVFSLLGLTSLLGFWALLMAHVVICLPIVVRTVTANIVSLPANLEKAAASLGAGPRKVFMTITLPLLSHGVGSGFLFAFIFSFTDVNTSIFLADPTQLPVTVKILGELQYGFPPTLAAVAMITILIPSAAMLILHQLGRLVKK